MMPDGRRALLRVLQVITAREVAARVRVGRSTVSMWSAGHRVPCANARAMLEVHCQIPAVLWASSKRQAVYRAR